MPKKNERPLNASTRLERAPDGGAFFGIRVGSPEQLKGALALAVERCRGKSFAPMYWIYGPRGGGARRGWPIKGVCPVVWGYAGVLYTQFPPWLRDELLPYAERIARSESTPARRLERARALGRFAITESFRLWAFDPLEGREAELLKVFDENPAGSEPLCRELLNSIKAPRCATPLFTTVSSVSTLRPEADNLSALRNSILDVGGIPALVAEESTTREGFLAAWGRALETLNLILE